MAVAKKLEVGELIEISGRRYEVVTDRTGGLTLESPITPVSELYAERAWKPATAKDLERLTRGDLADGEG